MVSCHRLQPQTAIPILPSDPIVSQRSKRFSNLADIVTSFRHVRNQSGSECYKRVVCMCRSLYDISIDVMAERGFCRVLYLVRTDPVLGRLQVQFSQIINRLRIHCPDTVIVSLVASICLIISAYTDVPSNVMYNPPFDKVLRIDRVSGYFKTHESRFLCRSV